MNATPEKDTFRGSVESYYGQPLTDDQWDEVDLHIGKLTDYAYDEAEGMGELPTEFSQRYFDAEQFAYDLWVGGDVVALFDTSKLDRRAVEVSYGAWWTNPNEF